MKKAVFVFIVSLVGVAIAHAALYRVVVIGDSIGTGFGVEKMESFVGRLEKGIRKEHPELRLINLSAAGRTLRSTEDELNQLLSFGGAPSICIVEVGGNDFLAKVSSADALVRLDRICRTLRGKYPKIPIVLVGVGYSGTENTNPYREVARRFSLQCVDNFVWQRPEAIQLRQEDKIHPNANGHLEIANAVLRTLAESPK